MSLFWNPLIKDVHLKVSRSFEHQVEKRFGILTKRKQNDGKVILKYLKDYIYNK